ncbi:DUF2577 domain-containing protein [Caldalkalibacillus mannanilyticus]|uniref:DUF2577 domain-containing protein n=1 Tax=Caldalkalibacillus mannanilyticus TaxID=1418 RepID=UPI00046805FB|nr:DUF2577 domain-containing protein [Caldalkalibacillus mannanilyticus]
MLQAIKQAAMDALEASNPVAILFGTITKNHPLEVNVDQRFTLTEDFLILTEATKEVKVNIGGTEYTLREGIKSGDKVLLLRMQGGQKFLLLDRVVDS